jgi:lysophospholipase L1-like esterase
VKTLQQKHPFTPILLSEHSGPESTEILDNKRKEEADKINEVIRKVYNDLRQEGVSGIYLLTAKDIGLAGSSTVDGLHPNDVGMMQYAVAYEKIIREILHEPVGRVSTCIPLTQSRDGWYDWQERHADILRLSKESPPQALIIGNSIIHFWGGKPVAPISRGVESWNKYFGPYEVRNLGFGWDKIENVLWRVYHDELDGFYAKTIVMLIGTNNLSENTDQEIIAGLKMLLHQVLVRQNRARLILSGLLPRRNAEKRIHTLNREIKKLALQMKITYIDPGSQLLLENGHLNEKLFEDGLHPNAAGYEKMGVSIKPFFNQ